MLGYKLDREQLLLLWISLVAGLFFVVLGLYYLIQGSLFVVDCFLGLVGLLLFLFFYNRLGLDISSYVLFLSLIIVHSLGLYGSSPFGVRFDHYIHFFGGFVIAFIASRVFFDVRGVRKYVMLVLVSLGVGAVGEIIEWLGYGILGVGDGFLFFGLGDEGEWRNAILDMLFNLFGALFFVCISFFRKE